MFDVVAHLTLDRTEVCGQTSGMGKVFSLRLFLLDNHMNNRPNSQISSRKQHKQARSTVLVSTILEAAIRVLAEEGTQRFTAARVAETAGVNVGLLYQYFPNNAAILFRFKSDKWRQTNEQWRTILGNGKREPLARLHDLVHAILHSEPEEAALRVAPVDTGWVYRDASQAQEIHADGDRIVDTFMREALPAVQDAARQVAGELIIMTMAAVGKELSEKPRPAAE